MGLVSPARVPYRTVLAAWWIFKFPTLPPSIRILFFADDAIAFRFPVVATEQRLPRFKFSGPVGFRSLVS